MNRYIVGGYVRDTLLGLDPHDRDWVVVGESPETMLTAGFEQVGNDFPVFLHPETREEHALARTERQIGHGHTAFTCEWRGVMLEQDLARRDVTVNTMAMTEQGEIIDPYGGQQDLAAKILRHMNAEAFAEDPLRVLRVCRLAAKLDFTIHPATRLLMTKMVSTGQLAHLTPERVWAEVAKGLMTDQPGYFLQTLAQCGALAVIMPEVSALIGIPQPVKHHPEGDVFTHVCMCLDVSAHDDAELPVRFAVLCHDLGKALTPRADYPRHIDHDMLGVESVRELSNRLKVPAVCERLAMLVCQEHTNVHRAVEARPATLLKILKRADAFRQSSMLTGLLQAAMCDARGRRGYEDVAYPSTGVLITAKDAANTVDARSIVASNPKSIPDAIDQARIRAIKGAVDAIRAERV